MTGDLENHFERAIIASIQESKEAGYTPSYFIRMLGEMGAVPAARKLLATDRPSEGFTRMWELKKLHITVEAIVLRPEFASLFTEQEQAIARQRLKEYGFIPESDKSK